MQLIQLLAYVLDPARTEAELRALGSTLGITLAPGISRDDMRDELALHINTHPTDVIPPPAVALVTHAGYVLPATTPATAGTTTAAGTTTTTTTTPPGAAGAAAAVPPPPPVVVVPWYKQRGAQVVGGLVLAALLLLGFAYFWNQNDDDDDVREADDIPNVTVVAPTSTAGAAPTSTPVPTQTATPTPEPTRVSGSVTLPDPLDCGEWKVNCEKIINDLRNGVRSDIAKAKAEAEELVKKATVALQNNGGNTNPGSGPNGAQVTTTNPPSGPTNGDNTIVTTRRSDGRSNVAHSTMPNESIKCESPFENNGGYAATGVGLSATYKCTTAEGFTTLVFGVSVHDHNNPDMSWEGVGGFRAIVGPATWNVSITDGAYSTKPSGASYEDYCTRLAQHDDPDNNWVADTAMLPSSWDPNCGR